MPMRLEGSCRCGAVSFSVDSHTPYPYQRCYCSICRKSAGGGGYAINIMGVADTLKVKGNSALGVWNAPIDGHKGSADRQVGPHDDCFDRYPELSIEDWHRKHELWIE